ncbi:uncharacterized protein LOC125513089 [Triticum urartu]|uniref:uncharacterized protein LOC125513089 n=1 Tax=Triticum urartu TaxID=4572 RepID=UPI002043FD27|nr:uncharacterized protein LOC125513089 [Triticum urartu]
MGHSIVLFGRVVDFSFLEPATGGGGGELICSAWEGIYGLQSQQELRDAGTEYMGTFKASAVIADPPQLCSLRILVPTEYFSVPPPLQDMHFARISSADRHLFALRAGDWRPGSGMMDIGGYLIYDACKDSLSVVPKLLEDDFHAAIGCQSAVVMCNGDDGGYFLAELVWLRPKYSQAAIWLWKSSAPGWSLNPAHLSLPPGFCSSLSFSYRGSILCWVDLLGGMVMCDLGKDCSNLDRPELRFIQLPKDCPSYDSSDLCNRYHLCPEKFRSMACVGDTIKFVTMDGNVEEQGFALTVYSLLPDLSDWEISSKYNVENIWANESYQSTTSMAKIPPSFPVLSTHEDGVIYLVFTDLTVVDDPPHVSGWTGQRRVVFKSQYLVRVDIENNKVHCYPPTTDCSIDDYLLCSDFSAYRQCVQDHPREIEATEMVASGKRMKL